MMLVSHSMEQEGDMWDLGLTQDTSVTSQAQDIWEGSRSTVMWWTEYDGHNPDSPWFNLKDFNGSGNFLEKKGILWTKNSSPGLSQQAK